MGETVEDVSRFLDHSSLAVRHVEENPEVTLKLLDRCVEWYRLQGNSLLDSKQVRALLDLLAPLTLGERTLREVPANKDDDAAAGGQGGGMLRDAFLWH